MTTETEQRGWINEAVRLRFEQYSREHFGDVSSIPDLCETFANFGARRAVEGMAIFNDLVPRLRRLEERIAELADVVALLTGTEQP